MTRVCVYVDEGGLSSCRCTRGKFVDDLDGFASSLGLISARFLRIVHLICGVSFNLWRCEFDWCDLVLIMDLNYVML